MESEVCVEKTRNEEDSSRERVCLETISVMEAKDVEPSKVVAAAALGPITPDPDRENGEAPLEFKSPLTWVSSPPRVVCLDSNVPGSDIGSPSPRTPKEDVFNSFAPGPDEMMLAPRLKKYLEESRNNVTRRLNFGASPEYKEVGKLEDCVEDPPISQEDKFFESVYESFLEAIVSKQAEGVLAEPPLPSKSGYDGFETPKSLPLLNDVADTCPGAPVKPTRKLRSIDQGLCKKLEF